jgi:hypothetical protein
MKPLKTLLVMFSLSVLLTSCGAFKEKCDCPNVGYWDGKEQKKQDQNTPEANATTSASR